MNKLILKIRTHLIYIISKLGLMKFILLVLKWLSFPIFILGLCGLFACSWSIWMIWLSIGLGVFGLILGLILWDLDISLQDCWIKSPLDLLDTKISAGVDMGLEFFMSPFAILFLTQLNIII